MIPQRRAQWRSLAGGELSPEMYGRIDLPRHNIGLKQCYNTLVTPQGALENRAGSRFITTTNDNQPAWLHPFVRADGQGFLVEFGDSYIRVLSGGNLIFAEPDPGDTFTVTDVDIWTPADGSTITPVVFTTSAPHGFNVGDAIRFQGFTLVNPDAAGNNILQGFMNTTWYVYKVPTAETFQIIAYPPTASGGNVVANLGFENGANGWTFTSSSMAPPASAQAAIDNTAPVQDGSFSLKLGVASNPNGHSVTAVADARFAVIPGQFVDVSMYIYGNSATPGADEPIIARGIQWYTAAGVALSTEQSAFIETGDTEDTFTEYTVSGTAPAGAAFFAPYVAAAWGDGAWAVDSFVVDYDAQMWQQFSGAPYNGLVNGGTVALAADSNPIALTPPYTQSHIRFASFAQFVDDLTIAHRLYPTARLTRVSDNEWTYTAVTFNVALAAPANITAAAVGTPGADPIDYLYTVTTVNDDGAESAIGTPDTAANELRTAGNSNEVSWDAVATTFRYNVYKSIGGSVYGFIGGSEGLALTDNNITPDFSKQPPEAIAAFDTDGQYPGVVTFHDQRMILASTLDEPQSWYASGLAAFDYFKAGFPPQDDEAFTYELAAVRAAPIAHAMALTELLLFTSSAVFRIPATEDNRFSPTTVAAVPVAAIGAHELAKPQADGINVLFPAERGGHLYRLEPTDSYIGYRPEDLSVIAGHLIEGKDWVQTAIRRAPYPVWFGLRDDGTIAALTFLPEQEVFAWHTHELPGAFIESIAVVPEGQNDSLYVIARRTIGGETVRYIERVETRYFATQADAYFVDAGVTYRGAVTSEVTGLDHLEGEEVMVLADGRVQGPFTVESGAVTLDDSASTIHVGLSFESLIETMPLAYAGEEGFGVGIMKNLSQVWLRIKQTLGVQAGPSFDEDDLRPLEEPEDDLLGGTPELRDGVVPVDMSPAWNQDATVCIVQNQPLPMTLTGIAVDFVDG